MQQLKLEDLIRDKIPLTVADSRGFHSLKCQCCNDYKVRAGFKFDQGFVIYNCWNCSAKAVYEEFSGNLSKKFRSILNDFGIDDSDISLVINTTFFFKKPQTEKITLDSLTKINTATPETKLPPKCLPLGHHEFLDYQEKLISYLIERKVDVLKYPFYFSLEPRFIDRIIIPFYRQGRLIYWQARSINPKEKKRYDNAPVGRDAVMFNFDRLYDYTRGPLLVTEGVFDALMFNGLAILGSSLNEAKIQLLSKSPRRLVFVIDKDRNGRLLAEKVLSLGWDITFCPNGAEDLNKSVQRFGKTWTASQLIKNIPSTPDLAQLAINLNCK